MLNGIDPIIIFQFSKKLTLEEEIIAMVPVIAGQPTMVDLPPIPIYFTESIENLVGIFIDSEDKNVDINTDVQTLSNGQTPDVNQKGVSSIVTINLLAKRDSLQLALFSSMIDLVFEKLTSKEYSITYLHGSITIFRGVLHSFSVNQNSSDDRISVKIELSKGSKTPEKVNPTPVVPGTTGLLPTPSLS